jgi:hypothetical protein
LAVVVVGLSLVGGLARASLYQLSEVPLLVKDRDARKLRKARIFSTDDVLAKGGTAEGRAALARASGLPRATIDTLARRADLLRLDSISPDWALLLEAAGVKSVAQLATWDPEALVKAAGAASRAKKIAPPPDARLRAWVAQAKALPVVLK